MTAISYSIALGQPLESVTASTNAPSGGNGTIELRMDQTAGAITDGSVVGGTRVLKKGEIWQMLKILEQQLIKDSTVAQ